MVSAQGTPDSQYTSVVDAVDGTVADDTVLTIDAHLNTETPQITASSLAIVASHLESIGREQLSGTLFCRSRQLEFGNRRLFFTAYEATALALCLTEEQARARDERNIELVDSITQFGETLYESVPREIGPLAESFQHTQIPNVKVTGRDFVDPFWAIAGWDNLCLVDQYGNELSSKQSVLNDPNDRD